MYTYSIGVPMDHIKRITWDLTAFWTLKDLCNLRVNGGFLDAAGMIYVCEASFAITGTKHKKIK